MSFRREAHTPRGGPDGGDGGKGGDVQLIADRNVASLLAFRDHPHRRAASGGHGAGKKKRGAAGEDLEVAVPPGTTVRDRQGTLLADLVSHGDRFTAARGGHGGAGNARFLTNSRRVPSFAEQGEYGQEAWLELELRLLADAALVGFPNVGKSTLISRVSAAHPKIAAYPFTTLEPHLGVVKFHEHEFVLADIPGIVEGAAEGRGLGHEFLRHTERARVLVLVLDLAEVNGIEPSRQEEILLDELRRYRPELLERPRVVVGNKTDVARFPFDPDSDAERERFAVSAVTGDGLDPLLGAIAARVEEARRSEPERSAYVVHRPEEEGFSVARDDDGTLRVRGRKAERVVAMADLTNPDAIDYVQGRFRRMGVERALERAGVREGETVRIGPVELEYRTSAGPRP